MLHYNLRFPFTIHWNLFFFNWSIAVLKKKWDIVVWGFPGGSVVKNPPANAGDTGSISELGRSPGEGNGNPLQYSCLENSMDRAAWWATVPGIGYDWVANTHTAVTHFQTSIHIRLRMEDKSDPRLTSSLPPWALEHLTFLSLLLSWNSSLAFAIPTTLFFLSPCGLNLILVLRTWYFSGSALLSLLCLCTC